MDQIGDVPGLWVGYGGSCDHDGLDYSQRDGFSHIEWGILDPISFDLAIESLVQDDVNLVVVGLSGVG